jgi:23S rRNA (cytidine2498-2'-O)-methyltransferase
MQSTFKVNRAHDALGVVVQCRPGFEADAGQELQASAARLAARLQSQPQSGFVFLALEAPQPHDELRRRLDTSRLVFARQGFQVLAVIDDLPERDRLTPLVERIEGFQERFSAILLETPDTNEGKQQSGFLGRFGPLLEAALTKSGTLRVRLAAPARGCTCSSSAPVRCGSG